MLYTISTPGPQVVLTLTPDMSINATNLYRTDLLLEHAVSSSFSAIIFDLGSLSSLNAVGRWVIFQVVCKANERGKRVFLYNVPSSIQSDLDEAGILSLGWLVHTKAELEALLRGDQISVKSTVTLPQMGNMNGTIAVAQGTRDSSQGLV